MSWLGLHRYVQSTAVVDSAATLTAGVTVTASLTPNTKGAWVELVASMSHGVSLLCLTLRASSVSTTDTGMLLDVGVGAAGSEVVVVPDLLAGFIDFPVTIPLPVAIPAGSRIALRCQSVTASTTVRAGATLFGESPLETRGWAGPVTAYGVNVATSHAVALPNPAAVHTKTGWVEVAASTTRPHKALILLVQGQDSTLTNAKHLIDVAIGAAANEQIVDRDIFYEMSATERILTGPVPPIYPVHLPIPTGTRIAARHQQDGTGSNIEVAVYGVG